MRTAERLGSGNFDHVVLFDVLSNLSTFASSIVPLLPRGCRRRIAPNHNSTTGDNL